MSERGRDDVEEAKAVRGLLERRFKPRKSPNCINEVAASV
jgi:hypothetical protein